MTKMRRVYDWFINNHTGKMPTPAEFIFRSREISKIELRERKQKQIAEGRQDKRKGIPMPKNVKVAMEALVDRWTLNSKNS
jgi:hypothetical protein